MDIRITTVLILGLTLSVWGCGGDDGNGKSNGTGNCEFSACGGDVVGTWGVVDLCIDNPERIVGLTGLPSECSDLIGDLDYNPDGEFVFREDGTGEADVSFTVDVEMKFTESCISAQAGQQVSLSPTVCSSMEAAWSNESEFQGGSCEAANNACVCLITSDEHSVASGGDYRVEGERITDGSESDPYCVSGNRLQIQTQTQGVVGVVTLEKK